MKHATDEELTGSWYVYFPLAPFYLIQMLTRGSVLGKALLCTMVLASYEVNVADAEGTDMATGGKTLSKDELAEVSVCCYWPTMREY